MTLFVSWVLRLNMRKIYYHFVYYFGFQVRYFFESALIDF